MAPLLKHGDLSSLKNRTLYWHFPAYLEGGNQESADQMFRSRPVSVIRQDEWKLIENYEDQSLELYNLKKDLSETQNVASQYPQKAKELKRTLDDKKEEVNAPCRFKQNPLYQPNLNQ